MKVSNRISPYLFLVVILKLVYAHHDDVKFLSCLLTVAERVRGDYAEADETHGTIEVMSHDPGSVCT